jgi:hypothetical protein
MPNSQINKYIYIVLYLKNAVNLPFRRIDCEFMSKMSVVILSQSSYRLEVTKELMERLRSVADTSESETCSNYYIKGEIYEWFYKACFDSNRSRLH